MAHEATRLRQLERQVQKQILGAQHQRGHRLDLDRVRPRPELFDRHVLGCGPPGGEMIVDVEGSEALRAQRRETGRRVGPRAWRFPQAAEHRLDPGPIAALDQEIEVPHRAPGRRGIDQGGQRRPLQDDHGHARRRQPLEGHPQHLALRHAVDGVLVVQVAEARQHRLGTWPAWAAGCKWV